MGNLHLVTGYAGANHITSADHGAFHEHLLRRGDFVLEAGDNLAAAIVTNNQVRISDGELMMQGRHVRLEPGTYVDMTIENGAQAMLRHDLIVARYTRNPDTGVEECNLVVIKGAAVNKDPVDPAHTTGDINVSKDLKHDFPLYRVRLNGLSIEGIDALFTAQPALYDQMGQLLEVLPELVESKDVYIGAAEPTGEKRPKLWIDPTDNREIVIPRNLLDNSDFTNPVNQRGQTSYVVPGEHTIDRWMSNGTVEIVDGGIRVSSGVFRQRIENLDVNKTYTLAAEDTSGDVHVVTGVPQNGAFNDGADFELCVRIGADHVVVGLKSGLAYKWAALYEGEYTAETLPPYVAKGYGAELLECQRYYQKYQMLVGAASGWSLNRIYVNVRPVMRIKPTATVNHTGTGTPSVYVRADQTLDITCSSGYADTNIALSADL